MRLTRIEFNGYKRLAQTSCNVDGKLIAFVGPNEAGKSSVLEALAWLDAENDKPLPVEFRARDRPTLNRVPVVSATYTLDDDDREGMRILGIAGSPGIFKISKFADGRVETELSPAARWSAHIFEDAGTALRVESARLTSADERRGRIESMISLLDRGPDVRWTASEISQLAEVSNAPEVDSVAGLLAAVLRAGSGHNLALRVAGDTRPRFRLFDKTDHELKPSYDLLDRTLKEHVPAGLHNLLTMAGLDVEFLLEMIEDYSAADVYQELKRANDRILRAVQEGWRQSPLTVRLGLDGSVLRIFIDELTRGGMTSVAERSDGLRTFIALAGFLHTMPPNDAILLIDEAETHLHLDAQADLMGMLLQQDVANQILYTTHSPGCLPPDLGTGIRLVAPSTRKPETSELRNDFWANEGPGFSPLLFKMGASAAAFSACRYAVIAEGPTEMVLLPTLIKLATGEPHLLYQVAPGLANAPADDARLGEVAARTAYLVDGDAGGASKKAQLVTAGVQADHVLSLPSGQAVEDLLTAASHLGAINAHFVDCGLKHRVRAADLDVGRTRGKAVSDWCRANKINPPGKTVIASRLVNNPDQIELEPEGAAFLKDLHAKLTEILKL